MKKSKSVHDRRPVNCLLVEGVNDQHVLFHLFEYHHIPETFHIEVKNGVEALLNDLDMELERSGLTRLGVIVDADAHLQERWNSLRNILIGYGYTSVPQQPAVDGTIITEDGLPVVGIWLMPDNRLPGMLEDFLHFLVPANDGLWTLAEEITQKVEAQECRFRSAHRSKAKIHTWLAWQGEPGKPLGQAITARYLDANAPHAHRLVHWLRQLFELA